MSETHSPQRPAVKARGAVWLTLAAYIVIAFLLFGSACTPLNFAMASSDRLGLPHWRTVAWVAVAVSALTFIRPLKAYITPTWRPALFVVASLTLPTLSVGLYADWKRREVVRAFKADHLVEHSFFRSIREVPEEFQFFLHTAALKNCVPYAWSYRAMAFYELHPRDMANTLPSKWLVMCSLPPQT